MKTKIQNILKYNILIVEDEEVLRKILVDTLKSLGINVFEASNGLEALLLLKYNSDINIICTDINMPEMNGIELIKILKKGFPNIPYIVMSTENRKDKYEKQKIELDIKYEVPKPINVINLINTIYYLLYQSEEK